MKKTITLALVFSFVFALLLQMPVLAEDSATSSDNNVPNLNSVKPEPRMPLAGKSSSTPMTGKDLEKIPSQDYMKYFREIRKIGNDLFGIRKPAAEIEKLKQENKTENKATSTKGLEKISSTTQMNLFEKITKIGNDLFGIRKPETKKASSSPENKAANLEKITSLNDVKFFEQIRKVGNDLFGIRKKGTYVMPNLSSEHIACASAAIDAKDTKISAALTLAASEISAAISARGLCQKAALAVSTEKQGALNTCNKTFNETSKIANEKVKNSQKETWNTYTASLKTCAQAAGTSEVKIEDGGQNVGETLNR